MAVAGAGGVPAAGAVAVVMNVAVTNTSAPSYLTVHPAGEPRPLAANLNWVPGDTASNRVVAKLGAGGKVTLFNAAGETVVDVNGWFTDASSTGTAGNYVPLVPARVLDTRTGIGDVAGPSTPAPPPTSRSPDAAACRKARSAPSSSTSP